MGFVGGRGEAHVHGAARRVGADDLGGRGLGQRFPCRPNARRPPWRIGTARTTPDAPGRSIGPGAPARPREGRLDVAVRTIRDRGDADAQAGAGIARRRSRRRRLGVGDRDRGERPVVRIVDPRQDGTAALVVDDGQVGRVGRAAALVAPEPARGLLGGDPAPEPTGADVLRSAHRQVLGPLGRPELRLLQHVAPDGTAHVGRGRQPDGLDRVESAPSIGQLLADEELLRLAEDVAIAAGPVESPVFPVAEPHPDGPVGPDDLGLHAEAMPLQLLDRDPARHVGPDRGPFAEELKLLHAEREDDVAAIGEMIEAPAAEQVREAVDDDDVGVQSRRPAVLDQRLPGQHAQGAVDPAVGDLAHLDHRLHRRPVEEPLLGVDRLGREPAGREHPPGPRDRPAGVRVPRRRRPPRPRRPGAGLPTGRRARG